MDLQQSPQTLPAPPEPTHPLECLRLIELPSCVVCGVPTPFYCGGCLAGPAFCSPGHFMAYWPTHSLSCKRDATSHSAVGAAHGVEPVHPYPGSITLTTRSAAPPPVSLDDMRLPVPVNYDRPYNYTINALYAQHDKDRCRFLYLNLSPTPAQDELPIRIQDCFEPAARVRSFVIRRDAFLVPLDTPFHIFYCAHSYAGRRNMNQALSQLTGPKDPSNPRPWFGSVVVLKFASRACDKYADMTAGNVVTVRDYFAYYA